MLLGVAGLLTGIIDYGTYLCAVAFGAALAIYIPALERRIKSDTKPHHADRFILIASLLFGLSGLAYLAFNLGNLFPSSTVLPASISNEWLFGLGTALLILGFLQFIPITFVTWFPNSQFPQRIKRRFTLKSLVDSAIHVTSIVGLVILQSFNLAALIGDLQAVITSHVTFTWTSGSYFVALILSFIALVPVAKSLIETPNEPLHGRGWVFMGMFISPYAIIALLVILIGLGVL